MSLANFFLLFCFTISLVDIKSDFGFFLLEFALVLYVVTDFIIVLVLYRRLIYMDFVGVDETIQKIVTSSGLNGCFSSFIQIQLRVLMYLNTSDYYHYELIKNKYSHFSKAVAKKMIIKNIFLLIILSPFTLYVLHDTFGFTLMFVFGLSIISIIMFYIAEYKAVSFRTVSFDKDNIYIRYGLSNPTTIPLTLVNSVSRAFVTKPQSNKVKKISYGQNCNICIKLNTPIGYICSIHMNLDKPDDFIYELTTI